MPLLNNWANMYREKYISSDSDQFDKQEYMFHAIKEAFIAEVVYLKEEITELQNEIGGIREENEELKSMLEKIIVKLGI